MRRREGRYLLRTNLVGREPAQLWQFYIQLVEIEAAFKNLKDDLQLRPIYHQLQSRIEAHIFMAFIAYRLNVTLKARLRPLAAGLTPRSVLDKFATLQMLVSLIVNGVLAPNRYSPLIGLRAGCRARCSTAYLRIMDLTEDLFRDSGNRNLHFG